MIGTTRQRGPISLAFLLMVLIAAPAARAFDPPVCKNSYTEEQEIEVGNKAAAQVYEQMPVLRDSDPVAVYVRTLGAKLVKSAPGYAWPYNFHVVSSDEVNAFALPGGSIFVNLATVTAAESEAQLAGVIGHEISHVVMRHSTCNLTKQRKAALGYGLAQLGAGIALKNNGAASDLSQQMIGKVAGWQFLHMSRDSEKQADLLGTDILYQTGYDPRGMPQFFEIIEAKYGKGSAQFLSDHPNPGNRIQYVNAEIETLPARENNVKTSNDFTKVHTIAAGRAPLTAQQVSAGAWRQSSDFQHSAPSTR